MVVVVCQVLGGEKKDEGFERSEPILKSHIYWGRHLPDVLFG